MNYETTRDGVHLYRELDEYLNQKAKVKHLPDNVTVKDWYTVKAHDQTRKAQQTGIVDHILDGD